MTSTGGAHHQSLTDGNVYTTGSLNQTLDPGRRRILLTTSQDPESGESCAEIRIIKYCAEPSVRESP